MPGSSKTLFDTILIVLGLLSVLKKKRDFVCVKSLAILTQNLDLLECFLLCCSLSFPKTTDKPLAGLLK